MNANTTARRITVVLATVPVAAFLMAGTAFAAGNSGDISRPQPLSNADRTGNGANPGTLDGCGSYCSTRDGSASQNGRSDNTSSSKPCAGCVGKADNKNPQGQAPSGPVDHNAGYECDRNQGIGQGNPAHTGCTAPVAPVVTPPVVVPPVVTPPAVTPPAVTPPAVTPPAVTPPVCATDASMSASSAGCVPAAGSGTPVVTPPSVTPPVCTTEASMTAGSEGGCAPATAGSGSTTGTTTGTPAVTPAGNGNGSGTVAPQGSITDPAAVSGQSTNQPVLLGSGATKGSGAAFGSGSSAAAQSPTGLPFTGDNTGQIAVFALVLVAAGGGLVIGARRV